MSKNLKHRLHEARRLAGRSLQDRIQAAFTETKVVIGYVASTRLSKRYQIVLASDHTVYCTCEGWRWSKKKPKTCRHLEKFKSGVVPKEVM